MQVLVAVGHIVGSILALLVLGFFLLLVAGWETERNTKRALEEMSLALGVPVNDLSKEELAPRLTRLLSERFSSELLRNRLSDLCGVVQTLWGWLGSVLQLIVLVAAAWYAATESSDRAVFAWFAVAVAVFFWIVSAVFSLTCRLLTGRYPGQAKQARKSLAETLKSQSASLFAERHSE